MDSADRATPPEVSTTEPSQTPSLTAHNTVSPSMQEKVKQATTLGKELSKDMEKWVFDTAKLREEKEELNKKEDDFVKRRDELYAFIKSELDKLVPGVMNWGSRRNISNELKAGNALNIESEALFQEDDRIKKKEEENGLLRQHCNDKKVIFDQLMDEITKMSTESEQMNQSLLAACSWKSHADESIHVDNSNSRDDVSMHSASDQPSSSRSG
ncbi:hypothetical protein CAEBREN_15593 [Caenorhabditis brenneri]|uniref:Uncharacterized protein n=1 Tax=Caenorhabditis brenneri TaxID=135651 RepID=G0MBE3_CAEBE|nr:hypothetical protein CAEBREN_15593 [Caenorhabditis brenneri]